MRSEPPRTLLITRIPNEATAPETLELCWRVAPVAAGTRLELDVAAVASFVPRVLPLGGIGNLVAETLLASATDALGGAV